jgi:hypothetical protein
MKVDSKNRELPGIYLESTDKDLGTEASGSYNATSRTADCIGFRRFAAG